MTLEETILSQINKKTDKIIENCMYDWLAGRLIRRDDPDILFAHIFILVLKELELYYNAILAPLHTLVY